MAKTYDNLEDAKSKLYGTIVYYEDTPVYVKGVFNGVDAVPGGKENDFYLQVTDNLVGKKHSIKPVVDPKFNFTKFNLGYANHKTSAAWWYRMPLKQYRQGLKSDQLRFHASEKAMGMGGQFSFNGAMCINDMLMNVYPNIEVAEKEARDADYTRVVAFHKNFAMSYDHIHKDMILEYKGQVIGYIAGGNFHLIDECEHLHESLKEVCNAR
jgi:hypothetical protein